MATYEAAIATPPPVLPQALALYAWNVRIAAALLIPLHVCEVVLRNAVDDALASVYGVDWPWQSVFELSLPDPKVGFSARRELVRARMAQSRAGKVVADLKLVFWQKMFTGRFDERIWNGHLRRVLPGLGQSASVQAQRRHLHEELERVRTLRNRIAHHEPVFTRALEDDFARMRALIALRCAATAAWMDEFGRIDALLACKPD